jgi:hypothetical protein
VKDLEAAALLAELRSVNRNCLPRLTADRAAAPILAGALRLLMETPGEGRHPSSGRWPGDPLAPWSVKDVRYLAAVLWEEVRAVIVDPARGLTVDTALGAQPTEDLAQLFRVLLAAGSLEAELCKRRDAIDAALRGLSSVTALGHRVAEGTLAAIPRPA